MSGPARARPKTTGDEWDVLYPRRKGRWPGHGASGPLLYDPATRTVEAVSPQSDPTLGGLEPWMRVGTLIAYRAASRATVKLRVGDRPWFVKVSTPRRIERLVAAEDTLKMALPGGGPLRVQTGPDYVVHADAGGHDLHSLLETPEADEAIRIAAAVIARLHQAPIPPTATVGTPYGLADWAAWAADHDPDADPEALARAVHLDRRLPIPETASVLVHGDLHDKNILVGQGRARLIDLASVRIGHPAEDVGMLAAHLMLRSVQSTGATERGRHHATLLVRAYRRSGGPADPEVMAAHTARTLARLSCLYRMRRRWHLITSTLLRLAEETARTPTVV